MAAFTVNIQHVTITGKNLYVKN